jgi:hypothetical protein
MFESRPTDIQTGNLETWTIKHNYEYAPYNPDNADFTSVNPEDVKADNYYTLEIVESYISLKPAAISYNEFSYIRNLLDEKSDIYENEKKYVEDMFSKGIKQKLISSDFVDIKELPDNLYDVYYAYEIEETDVNNIATSKTITQVFTVYDDGKVQKIVDIQPGDI